MERSIFTRPEVLRELKKYVEVRLHTDRADEVSKRLAKLEQERLNDISMPIYEAVDPRTRKTVEVFRGADLPSGVQFREFLERNAR
jgi:hypothetical protein